MSKPEANSTHSEIKQAHHCSRPRWSIMRSRWCQFFKPDRAGRNPASIKPPLDQIAKLAKRWACCQDLLLAGWGSREDRRSSKHLQGGMIRSQSEKVTLQETGCNQHILQFRGHWVFFNRTNSKSHFLMEPRYLTCSRIGMRMNLEITAAKEGQVEEKNSSADKINTPKGQVTQWAWLSIH